MFEKEAKERARKIEENQTLGVYDNDEEYAQKIEFIKELKKENAKLKENRN